MVQKLAKSTRTNSRKVSGFIFAPTPPIPPTFNLSLVPLVLLMSEQFDFKDQDVDLKTVDYMKLLDTDRDQLVGFFDFLQPIMHVVPPEVLTAFTQD